MQHRSAALLVALVASSAMGCAALLGFDEWDARAPGSGGAAGDGGGGASNGGAASSCVEDAECPSSYCVDGICCDGPCNGLCFACTSDKTGGQDGTCARVLLGTDPDDDCPMPPTDFCGPVVGTCGCFDNVENGDETRLDCGGPTCAACGDVETACTDSMDDDGNGLVDCDDPTCAAKASCLPAIPGGWGPGAFYQGALPLPACPGGFDLIPFDGGVGIVAPPHTCDPCSCGQPAGQSCAPAATAAYDQSDCMGNGQFFPVPVNVCVDALNLTNVTSAKADPVPATGGTCALSGGEIIKTPASFSQHVRFCPTTNASQPDGCAACVSKPPGPFAPEPCISTGGAQSCPAGYGGRMVAFAEIMDDSACTACDCSVPVGTCSATVLVYQMDGCASVPAQLATNGVCVDLTGFTVESAMVTANVDQGSSSCTSSGGVATGSAVGVGAVTICCPQ